MSNKLTWLEEVKRDAEYITRKRIRENQEQKEYEASKVAPVEPEEVEEAPVVKSTEKKGK